MVILIKTDMPIKQTCFPIKKISQYTQFNLDIPLTVKTIIINVQAKNGKFSNVSREYRIKKWPEMCCNTTAKLQFLSPCRIKQRV